MLWLLLDLQWFFGCWWLWLQSFLLQTVMVALCGCPSLQCLPLGNPVTLFLLASRAPASSLVCHVVLLLLCLVQVGPHANIITMMPSQQQEQF